MSRAPEWETVVGLEVHVQLDTRSKLFVDAPPAFAPDAPNTFVTPYCLGLPGTLPRVDGEAVRKAIRTALALGFTVHASSRFARKHYFYPDLPKGYQITQANEPLATGGRLEVPGFDSALRLTRLHLEEDAGKAVSEGPQQIGLDYNRAGVPLVEIVSEPDLRSGEAAAAALRELRAIVRALGVSDGSLERGSMRCDVNVSVRRRGDPEPGVRCEVKNVSGFRFVAQAVEAEAARQIEIRQQGEPVLSETRAFDAVRRTTRRLRSKELVPDYRYLPDPDLPALVLSAEQIQAARAALPELPGARRRRWATLGLPAEHALSFAADPELSELFDSAARLNPQRAAAVGDLVKTAVRARIREDRSALARIRPEWLVELAELRAQGQVSSTQQKMLVDRLLDGSSATVAAALVEIGGVQVSDEATLEGWVDAVLAAHPAEVESYRGGKSGLLGFFVGRVMRASGGRADPVATKRRLVARLG